MHEHSCLTPDLRGDMGPLLTTLFRGFGKDVYITAPFHCAYGFKFTLRDGVGEVEHAARLQARRDDGRHFVTSGSQPMQHQVT